MEDTKADATAILVLDFPVTRGETLREKEDDQVNTQGEVIDGIENTQPMDCF